MKNSFYCTLNCLSCNPDLIMKTQWNLAIRNLVITVRLGKRIVGVLTDAFLWNKCPCLTIVRINLVMRMELPLTEAHSYCEIPVQYLD